MTCLIRKTPVVFTPEEKVRQALLHLMVHSLGYPAGLIGVELELDSIPSLSSRNLPKRRADILVFSPMVLPLLLVECKSGAITLSAIQQLVGYNLFIKAPYIVLANPKEIKTGILRQGEWVFTQGIPNYENIKSSREKSPDIKEEYSNDAS